LVWLGDGATSASTGPVKAEVSKLAYLEAVGADRLDLSAIPPDRLRQLAAVAERSTPTALRQMDPAGASPRHVRSARARPLRRDSSRKPATSAAPGLLS
jgi:hypothetical protein